MYLYSLYIYYMRICIKSHHITIYRFIYIYMCVYMHVYEREQRDWLLQTDMIVEASLRFVGLTFKLKILAWLYIAVLSLKWVWRQSGWRTPSFLGDLSLLRASTDWMQPIHNTKGNLVYKKSANLNVNHILKIPSQ